MGAALAPLVLTLQTTLNDLGGVEWTEQAVKDALLEAERATVLIRPDATAARLTITCEPGAYQRLAGVTRLLDVVCKVVNGEPGRALRRVQLAELELFTPDWRSVRGEPQHWAFDEREPAAFFLYPAPRAPGSELQVLASLDPAPYAGTAPATTVAAEWAPALIEYALYRLFNADVEGSVNLARSGQHYQNWATLVGLKVQAAKITGPKNPEHKD